MIINLNKSQSGSVISCNNQQSRLLLALVIDGIMWLLIVTIHISVSTIIGNNNRQSVDDYVR